MLKTMSDIKMRIIYSISVLLVGICQVAVINGCILQVKLPLGILGYSPIDFNRLQFNKGDTVRFRCVSQHQITYNLTGSPKIRCESDNLWSAKPPKCKATLCSPSPPTVPNAILLSRVSIPGQTNKIGKIAYYNCTVGYSSPSLIKVCQKNGYWQGNVNCTRTICNRPVLANGLANYISLMYGSVATYACNKGYILSGSSTRICNAHGQWSGTQPKCSKLCPKIENTLNGHFEPAQQAYRPGQIITFKCISDRFVVKDSQTTRTCLDDGSWSGSGIKCVINQCGDVGSFSNGNVEYSRRPYVITTVAKFICNSGYKLIGKSTRVCQSDGKWSSKKNPTCKALSCAEPGVVTNGRHFPINSKASYPYGTTLTFSCLSQYYLYGNATTKCTAYGVSPYWTHAPPECLTLVQFSSRCQEKGGHLSRHPLRCTKDTIPPHVNDDSHSRRQLDTLTIVTASAGSTLGALVILLSIMVFVRRFHRNRRFRHQNIRSRFYSDDDHVTLITCPRGYHFSLPSYDEAMSQVQRDPPPFDTVVPDNATTVINNNINITMPSDDNSRNRETGDSRTHERTILQVSADQQVNIVNNPMPENSQGEIDANSTDNPVDNSARNSISSQESLPISEPPSSGISEDEQSINESQPLIGSN